MRTECTGSGHFGIFSFRQPESLSVNSAGVNKPRAWWGRTLWWSRRDPSRARFTSPEVAPVDRPYNPTAGCGCCARHCRYCRGGGVEGHARGMPASRRAGSESVRSTGRRLQEGGQACNSLTFRFLGLWKSKVCLSRQRGVRSPSPVGISVPMRQQSPGPKFRNVSEPIHGIQCASPTPTRHFEDNRSGGRCGRS